MKLRSYILLACVFSIAFFINCKKKDKDPTPTSTLTSTAGPRPYATLSTDNISAITQTSAVGGGNVQFDGGSLVTTVGVCWDTTTHLSLSKPHTVNAGSIGTYTCALNDLLPNKTYYVRAYATNATGTSFGDQVSFTTP